MKRAAVIFLIGLVLLSVAGLVPWSYEQRVLWAVRINGFYEYPAGSQKPMDLAAERLARERILRIAVNCAIVVVVK